MANRKRKIVLRVPVTQEERELIKQKMALLHTKNFSAYARKMLIDGYIVNMDTTDIRAQTAEIQKIGVNVNQIAKRLNSMGPVYAQDIEDIKGALAQIWQLQRWKTCGPSLAYGAGGAGRQRRWPRKEVQESGSA